jgi:hypothetical protein
LLAHGWWFSLGSSTTKTGHHAIAEILLKVALSTKNQTNSNQTFNKGRKLIYWTSFLKIHHQYHPGNFFFNWMNAEMVN